MGAQWHVFYIIVIIILVVELLRRYCKIKLDYERLMDLQNVWIYNLIQGKSIAHFFEINSIRTIGICGYNYLADELFNEIYDKNVTVLFFIDDKEKGVMSFYPNCKVLGMDDIKNNRSEHPDAIIITDILKYDKYKHGIDRFYKGKVISIETLVWWMGGK